MACSWYNHTEVWTGIVQQVHELFEASLNLTNLISTRYNLEDTTTPVLANPTATKPVTPANGEAISDSSLLADKILREWEAVRNIPNELRKPKLVSVTKAILGDVTVPRLDEATAASLRTPTSGNVQAVTAKTPQKLRDRIRVASLHLNDISAFFATWRPDTKFPPLNFAKHDVCNFHASDAMREALREASLIYREFTSGV